MVSETMFPAFKKAGCGTRYLFGCEDVLWEGYQRTALTAKHTTFVTTLRKAEPA